jgi:hypothetical protein
MDDQADAQAIERIVRGYAASIAKTPQEAEQFISQLAAAVQTDAAKLVHFGNTLFLILVRKRGMVEVHTIAHEEDSVTLAKNFVLLAKYLQGIGVKVAYTYTDDPKFDLIAKRTKLPFKKKPLTLPDGKRVTTYYVEF